MIWIGALIGFVIGFIAGAVLIFWIANTVSGGGYWR